jgi:predicted PurR-regulated permease PerM
MKTLDTERNLYDITIRLIVMLIIIVWCLKIIAPFTNIILWSLILAMAFAPIHNRLIKLFGGWPKLASFCIILICFAIILVPAWFFIEALVKEVMDLKTSFQGDHFTLIPPPSEQVKSWPLIGQPVYDLWHSASANLGATIVKYKDHLTGIGERVAKGLLSTTAGILQLILSLVIAGFLLTVKGLRESIGKFFRKIAGDRGDEFADLTYATVGKVVKGIMGVALIQAVLIGLGFLIAGVPYAGLWTLLVFIVAVLQLPVLLVVIPISIYMFSDREVLTAALWTIYWLLAGATQNIFTPLLLGKGAPVPMLVIFIGVLGGFIFSGFIGLFTGAIVLSIGYKLFVAWLNTAEKPANA